MSGNELELQKNLPRCISMLYDMELNQYLMTRAALLLSEKIDSLGRPKNIAAPKKQEDNDPVVSSVLLSILFVVIICALIAAVLGAIGGAIIAKGFFGKVFRFFGEALVFAIYGAGVGVIVGPIVTVIMRRREEKARNAKFENDKANYQKALTADANRIKLENKQKELLQNQRRLIYQRMDEAAKKLRRFYAVCNIDGDYRNLVSVGYMHEFIRLGVSKQLYGVNGLYYLIRKELRADQLQHTLDEISYKLDTIIDNQSKVYTEIVDMNNKCDRLCAATLRMAKDVAANKSSLKAIQENSEIAAYNTERIEAENRYQTFMLALGL